LQSHFSKRDDVIFLSITDENEKKVNNILRLFHFKSFVVSDTTRSTQKRFGITSLPTTFLINKQGHVKFVGNPNDIDIEKIDSILSFDDLGPIKSKTKGKSSMPSELYETYLNDSISNYFDISFSSNNLSNMSYIKLPKFKTLVSQRKFGSLMSNLLGCGENQIIVDDCLRFEKVSYCFKSDNIHDKNSINNVLLRNILNHFNLRLDSVKSNFETFTIEVQNPKLLDQSQNRSNGNISKGSHANGIMAIENNTLDILVNYIENTFGCKTYLQESLLELKYDMALKSFSFNDLNDSLKMYGLIIKRKKTNGFVYKIH
jgi:hypothetical protein